MSVKLTRICTIALLFLVMLLTSLISFGENDSISNVIANRLKTISKSVNQLQKIDELIALADIMETNNIHVVDNFVVDDLISIVVNEAEDSLFVDSVCHVLDNIGLKYRNNGNYSGALRFHNWALDLSDKINSPNLKSIIYNNIGVVYRRLDDYQTALSYHLKALTLAEKNKNLKSQAVAINSIGNIQMMIGNLDESLDYFKRSLIIEQKQNSLLGIAINLNNIGNVYNEKGNLTQALKYYMLSLDVNKEINSIKGIAISYNDIGNVYSQKGDFNKALKYYLDAFRINHNSENKHGLAYSYLRVGQLYTEMKLYDSAIRYLNPGLELSLQIGAKAFIKDFYYSLYSISRNKKEYEDAFEFLQLSNTYHDSIVNINVQKDIARLEVKFESERKENRIALLEQNAEIAELDIKKQKIINLLIFCAFVIALGLVIFLLYYLASKNHTNKLLIERNEIIEKTKTELDNYSKELLEAKMEADRTNIAKSEFLTNMSHEIRTPLNSVIGFADLLIKSVTDKKHLNYLHSIQTSGRTLLVLINDILDLSKIEAGKLNVDYDQIDARLIFKDFSRIFLHTLLEKNLKLITLIDKSLSDKIIFNELRLRQILINLVGNAIKFTHKGEINVSVISREKETKGVVDISIEISDTGIGIPDTDLEEIFEPFVQSKNNKTASGTGLGLTITKQLVEIMNGTINVTSKVGKGTIFYINFKDVRCIDSESKHKNIVYNSDDQFASLASSDEFLDAYDLTLFRDILTSEAKIQLDRIYNDFFEQAYRTRMSLHIALFISNLKTFSKKHSLYDFERYCEDLNKKLSSFDIDGMELMLRKFDDYYKKIT